MLQKMPTLHTQCKGAMAAGGFMCLYIACVNSALYVALEQ